LGGKGQEFTIFWDRVKPIKEKGLKEGGLERNKVLNWGPIFLVVRVTLSFRHTGFREPFFKGVRTNSTKTAFWTRVFCFPGSFLPHKMWGSTTLIGWNQHFLDKLENPPRRVLQIGNIPSNRGWVSENYKIPPQPGVWYLQDRTTGRCNVHLGLIFCGDKQPWEKRRGMIYSPLEKHTNESGVSKPRWVADKTRQNGAFSERKRTA